MEVLMYRTVQVGDQHWSATLRYGFDEQGAPDWSLSYECHGARQIGTAETVRRCEMLGNWALTIASYELGSAFLEKLGYKPARPGELEPDLNQLANPDDRDLYGYQKFKTLKDVKTFEADVLYEGFLFAA